ncbi:cupin domain-containing protein [Pontibacter locisalis]|uniref:Cupin domain-containing protein n=1 Tax=Pontibacter locisalis TaxID=1719035 RepID=A0ABW5IV28_9BACT
MKRKEFIKRSAIGLSVSLIAPSAFASTSSESKISKMAAKVIRSAEGKKVNVIGDNMTFKLTGEDTGGQFSLMQEYNEPGVGVPLHVHEHEDEIFKVLEGEIEMEVGDTKTVLRAGDIGFGPRGVPHAWRVVGTQKARVDLSIFPAGLENMFMELGQLPAGPPDFAKVTEICGRYGVRFV